MANILIIDDDKTVNEVFAEIAQELGHSASSEMTLKKGLEKAKKGDFDIVVLDVRLPDGDGLTSLPDIQSVDSSPEVIIITGYGDPDGAELAIKNGAWDYILKPSSMENIILTLTRALEYRAEKQSKKFPIVLKRGSIVGDSSKMNVVFERIAQAAVNKANVLITGETGTGKELYARAIHENSPVADRRFVVVDCAVLPESLVESTLFGHEKGAFTGADRAREGLIKQADGGTLFLDEVGELPLSSQKAFLRIIQEHKFRSVGGRREMEVEFRLIAATNRNLEEMADNGQFRKDLLYRLRSFTVESPPLRDRMEDVKELAVYYSNRLCEAYESETKGFSPEFIEALSLYDWPGNVRELINALEETLSNAKEEPVLYPYHLPINIRAKIKRDFVNTSSTKKDSINPVDPLEDKGNEIMKMKDFKELMESRYLKKLISISGGSKKDACSISGLSRTRLFELLKKYNIDL
jgi:two-component system NtrC family response regulator